MLLRWWWNLALFKLDHSIYHLLLPINHQRKSHWAGRLRLANSLAAGDHTCRVKTHETSKWSIVSSSWSHNWQRSWGNPLVARRSAVHHLLSVTNHMKNLHLPDAQLFQISGESSTSGCSSTSERSHKSRNLAMTITVTAPWNPTHFSQSIANCSLLCLPFRKQSKQVREIHTDHAANY
jgi:hypothetical protein